MTKKLLIVVNQPAFFISHRLAVAEGARDAGYEVHIATQPGPGVEHIRSLGFRHTEIPLVRSGRGILSEIRLMLVLWRLFWKLKPDVLHLVTIKPVLYGGIAARLAPVGGVVAAISGLGFIFVSTGFTASVARKLVGLLYRLALGKKNLRVIFQNRSDRDLFLRLKAVAPSKVEIIRGSGVDLCCYSREPESETGPVVCQASRLLWDKGVGEFVEAARILKARGVDVHFQLIGDVDTDNPATVSPDEVQAWQKEGVIEILGHRRDIAHLFSHAHVVVLPSYREGLPKVLVEAAACGRAVVTTNVPGCRDAIEPGVSGLLVPLRDAVSLADAIQKLVMDPELRARMGRAGRDLAERAFGIEAIVDQHLAIYRKLEPSS
ncbi:glycosyltransferase family 4 protein [Marinobacter orientalis]|uniref:Glycosyltransferase family 4 protein n=1 Tax=Marinobacter orientalis TaxID=1928859 RepID=A0A7Y0WTU9_9GAMM|nr:glycosyltransferase family 4 protein [Marinobacter orientalis]NMT65231.1 glycosyltransferase family 4 protein [Marinobacter orientalis]TGX48001.1 glycosyltransferase family 1 protein [Marinobacter orientalis]